MDAKASTAAQYTPDPWEKLRRLTPARIALGRAGTSLPTRALLEFQLHHARATDAVHAPLDRTALAEQLRAAGLQPVLVESQAASRAEYLQRPQLGRALALQSRERLCALARPCDVVIALADGLSAHAVERDGVPVTAMLAGRLRARGLSIGPVPIAQFGRVALQDDIGECLQARLVVTLIGERPGLLTPHSMGAYFVYSPRVGNTDAQRNCLSNIHSGGLSAQAAAEALEWLVVESLRREVSGVQLKDDRQIAGPAVQQEAILPLAGFPEEV